MVRNESEECDVILSGLDSDKISGSIQDPGVMDALWDEFEAYWNKKANRDERRNYILSLIRKQNDDEDEQRMTLIADAKRKP